MQVQQITIEDHQFDEAQSAHRACVGFEYDSGQRSMFFCTIKAAADVARAQLDAFLIKDATRQALRMPEFRSGREQLVFDGAPAAA